MRWEGYVARMGKRGMHVGFWWESQKERKICRWMNNIKINLTEIEWGCMDWIYLAQDRDRCMAFVNIVLNLRVP
jgi:hypothetical protein